MWLVRVELLEALDCQRGMILTQVRGVPELLVTSGGFSALEGIAQCQADGRFADAGMGDEGEGMVGIPPVDEMSGQEAAPKGEDKVLPQSVSEKFVEGLFRNELAYAFGSQSSDYKF